MKKSVIFVLVLAICVCTSGCHSRSLTLTLHQSTENISKIELTYSASQKTEPRIIKTILDNEIAEMVDELLTLTYQRTSPPCTVIGEYAINLYYENGDMEFIGSYINGYIDSSGKIDSNGWYIVDQDEFMEIFNKYAS